jgi:hypothetical protein
MPAFPFGLLGAGGLGIKLLHLNGLTLKKIGQKAEDKRNVNVSFSPRHFLLVHDSKCASWQTVKRHPLSF